MKRCGLVAVALLTVFGVSCKTTIGKPPACYEAISIHAARDYQFLFSHCSDPNRISNVGCSLENRLDYLEAYCASINRFRGDEDQD